ncbi:MAG: helix-turn-helix transcriptional regulator [Eubacteriales bacterium]|nr:helix-turn-helix transcriptional regulator [Eubacteriales bacterium]
MTYYRIRELREDKDLTQTYVAHYLNVTQKTYSRYETGEHEIPLGTLCRIADFHNVSTDFLLNRTDIKTPYPTKPKKRPVNK